MKTKRIVVAACLSLAICELSIPAQSFNYHSGDLLAAFSSGNGATNMIVDLGVMTGPGTNIVANVSTALTDVFGSNLNGVYWSLFSYSGSTLQLSDPRSPYNLANDPTSVNSLTASGQGQVTSKMGAIINGATSGYATVLFNQIITTSGGLNVGGNPVSYTVGVGTYGDFNGTWQWDTRNTMDGVNPSVSDVFQMNPGAANTAIYLGNVSIATDGVLTISAVPEPSTWAMLSGGFMSLLLFRRKTSIKQSTKS